MCRIFNHYSLGGDVSALLLAHRLKAAVARIKIKRTRRITNMIIWIVLLAFPF